MTTHFVAADPCIPNDELLQQPSILPSFQSSQAKKESTATLHKDSARMPPATILCGTQGHEVEPVSS